MASKSNFAANGRYSYGGGTVDLGSRLGWWDRKILPLSDTDVTFVITSKYAKRPDLLSYDLYGTPTLQWLILQYNTILDTNTEFVEGISITVPTKARVYTELLSKRSLTITST
jgi:hypothetical protein